MCMYPYRPADYVGLYRTHTCMLNNEHEAFWYRSDENLYFNGCPMIQPVDGSSCPTVPWTCNYPHSVQCDCAGPTDAPDSATDEAKWSCYVPHNPSWLVRPDTIDESKRIADLTAAERATWCEWYGCLPTNTYLDYSKDP
ncbi:MAG TPA: hypothetical protein VHU80_21785, partial [Polyangiaceae bacterium]|nr:hypothetical protein [Polyangiaceae bacterium]